MRKLYAFFTMVLSIIAVIIFTVPQILNPNKGIEFVGGYEIVYSVNEKDGAAIPDINDVADVIAERIDIAGVKNPQVSVEQNGDEEFIRVCVSSKNTDELADVLELIETDAEITFTDSEGNYLMGGEVLAEENGAVLSYEDGQPIVLLSIVDTDTFGSVTSNLVNKNMIAWIGYVGPGEVDGYDGDWDAVYNENTTATYEQSVAAYKKIIIDATVSTAITGDTAQITGSFSAEEATQKAKLLSAGNMDFILQRYDVMKVDGSYGADAFEKSIIAGLVGLLAIIAMMVIIYKIPGLIASLALCFYTVVTLAIFDLIGGEYGPDTIAAIVIGLGMAVDACIILFERLADELYKGRSLKSAYEESTKKSLSSIIDSNLTTIIAACALYFFGKRSVKGFATMLLITTVFNVVIMLLVTRLVMFLLVRSGKLDNKKYLFAVDEKKIPDINKGEVQTYFGKFTKVDFVAIAKKVFIGLLCLYAVGGLFAGGWSIYGAAAHTNDTVLNFGLDFQPGATASINISDLDEFKDVEGLDLLQIDGEYTEESIKAFLFDTLGYTNDSEIPTSVSVVTDYSGDDPTLAIKLEFANVGTNDDDVAFLTNFEEDVYTWVHFNDVDDYSDYITISQQVSSPTMAQATVLNALLSLLVAFALIVVYISIRFRYTYAIASIIALLCDCLSMFAIFAIFRIEVQVEFVSAVLAIIGYSINDTVVIFDRVREIAKETNFGKIDEEGRKQIVNKALQNCAGRSFWTTISTILPVLALIFIGADATLAFSIAMLVGLFSGVATSLFIAPGFWLMIEKRHMLRLKEKAIRDAQKHDELDSKGRPEELTVVGIND